MRLRNLLCLLGLLALSVAAFGEGQRWNNERMFIVPAPAGVQVDGDLSDWDKSGGVYTWVTPETQGMRSLRTYAMYDDQALYLGAEVKDVTPMMNVHDPDVNAPFGWDADAMQFRLYLKPTFPGNESAYNATVSYDCVHLLMWYYTTAQRPVLDLLYGFKYSTPQQGWKEGVVPSEFFAAVYKKWPDGLGYTFEYRIPWSTLSEQYKLKAGDMTAATFQNLWGTPDGQHTMGCGGWAYDLMSQPGFAFQSSVCWGKAIFSPTGNLPREITQEGVEPVPPVPLSFTYELPKDGLVTIALLDQQGSPVRNIVAAQARTAGKVVEAWDGLDDKGDPLPAGTYQWKGLYHDPLQVKWLLSVHNSGSPGYSTADGKGSWGGDHGVPCAVAAAGERMVLGWEIGECGWATVVTDLAGKKQWGGRWCCRHLTADDKYAYFWGGMGDMGVMRVQLADALQVKFGNKQQFVELPADFKGETSGLALCGDKLYVALPRAEEQPEAPNLLAEVDKEAGTLLRVLTVSPLAVRKMPRLGAIAVRNSQELYAVLGGQILVISLADGSSRLFAGEHLSDPQGLAVAPDGTLYVANRGTLQNVSVFSAAGKYLRSLGRAGGRPALGKWRGDGILNPAEIALDQQGRLWVTEANHNPKRISVWDTKSGKLVRDFFGGSAYSTYVAMDVADPTRVYCHGVQWKVDLKKGTWYPEAVVTADVGMGDFVFTPVTAPNGKQYAFNRFMTVFMRRGDIFEPVGGFLSPKHFEAEPWYAEFAKAHPNARLFFWSDNNGDSKATLEEVAADPFPVPYWGGYMDNRLSLYSAGAGDGPLNAYRLKLAKFLKNGIPTWDLSQVRMYGPASRGQSNYALGDPEEDAVYVLGGGCWGKKEFPGLNKYAGDGRHLWGYWNVATDWTVALNSGIPPKGTAWGATRWMGKGGEFLAALNYFGTIDLWTSDGLYVDKIYKDGRLGENGPDCISAEFFFGQFVRTKDGRYLLLAGDSDGRINELLGLDSVKRLAGTCTLTPGEVDKAAVERAAFSGQKAKAQPLVIHRLAGLNWALAKPITRKVDDQRRFSAAAAYDEKYLYLRYAVQSPSPLVNAITDPQLVFKGGNCLDLELQTNPQADPARKLAGLGDVRVLITRQNGQPCAVAYFKQTAGLTHQPLTLKSPTGEEVFDKIEVLAVEMDYKEETGGFTVLVKLPLEALGLKLQSAGTQRLDLGYRFGNSTGSQVGMRAYWSNTSALSNIIYDVPSETRMEPANWGTAVVE